MSVVHCDGCDNYIDTDFDVEGVFENTSPFAYWCSSCIETGEGDAMLAALLAERPDQYANCELCKTIREKDAALDCEDAACPFTHTKEEP